MRLGVLSCVVSLLLISAGLAGPADASIRKMTSIPAEPLDQALRALAKDRQFQVLYRADVVRNIKTAGAVGEFTPEEALNKLLAGTGLTYKYLDANTVTVFAQSSNPATSGGAPRDGDEPTKEGKKSSSGGFRVAQVDQGKAASNASVAGSEESLPKQKTIELEEVVVTGSRLPTVASQSAQDVRSYSKEQIQESGRNTVSDFLSTLPSASLAIGESGTQSFGYATTVQLHGLPIGTTLVLLDGRRLETSGSQASGKFFDLNSIPLAAVDRIEVVSEGSSAVYGSDAIAGVVNIILKKDFEGFAGGTSYGGADSTHDFLADIAWGLIGTRGSVSILGSYQRRTELEGFDRAITADNNYTRFGGIDARSNQCSPGTIYGLGGADLPGVGAPYAAVPKGYTGTPTQAEFVPTAGTLNSCSVNAYSSVIPGTIRYGALLNGHYEIMHSIDVFSQIIYTDVEQRAYAQPPGLYGVPGFQSYQVSASNPFNPFGVAVGVSGLIPSLGREGLPFDTTWIRALVGVRGELAGSWHWEFAAWDSDDHSKYLAANLLDYNATQSALNAANPSQALNPFIDGPLGAPSLLRSLIGRNLEVTYFGRKLASDLFFHGPLVTLPSGSVTAGIGAEYDRDTLGQDAVNDGFDPPGTMTHYARSSRAAFAEVRIPVLGRGGSEVQSGDLAVTAAGRYDKYSDFGSKTTPQVGFEWVPGAGFQVHGNYSKAFNAPSLRSLYASQFSFPSTVVDPTTGASEVATLVFGGNPKLRPESGQSRSIGVTWAGSSAFKPELGVSYWSVDEADNIQTLSAQTIVNNETLFPGAVTRNAAGLITQVNSTSQNYGLIQVRGIDIRSSVSVPTGHGTGVGSIAITKTTTYNAALIPGATEMNRDGVASDDGNWAPRWKGSATIGWSVASFKGSFTGRYIGTYRDYDSITRTVPSNFFLDANLRYTLDHVFPTVTRNNGSVDFEIGGINIFNRLPAFSNFDFGSVGYDAATGDIRGRYLYARVAGRF